MNIKIVLLILFFVMFLNKRFKKNAYTFYHMRDHI